MLNISQELAKAALQAELRRRRNITKPRPEIDVSRGHFFTEVEGVTVLIGPRSEIFTGLCRRYLDAETRKQEINSMIR